MVRAGAGDRGPGGYPPRPHSSRRLGWAVGHLVGAAQRVLDPPRPLTGRRDVVARPPAHERPRPEHHARGGDSLGRQCLGHVAVGPRGQLRHLPEALRRAALVSRHPGHLGPRQRLGAKPRHRQCGPRPRRMGHIPVRQLRCLPCPLRGWPSWRAEPRRRFTRLRGPRLRGVRCAGASMGRLGRGRCSLGQGLGHDDGGPAR